LELSQDLIWELSRESRTPVRKRLPKYCTLGRGRALTNNKPKYILATTQQLCVEAESVFVLKEGALH
jgi:hypothetical protein